MSFLEDKKTDQKFIFQNYIRIILFSILFVASLFVFFVSDLPINPLPIFTSLITAIILGFLNFSLFKRISYRKYFYFQSLVDIIIISTLVYFSGGISSPIYFLYILPIIVTSIFLTRRDTIYIATLSFIMFGIISDLIFLEIIPYYPLISTINISLSGFIYNLVMSFIAFSSIAVLSSFYFEQIRKTGAELENAQANLKDLILLNSTVLEKMENGFIVSDSKGNIISYNEKSKFLLDIKSKSNIFNLLSLHSTTEEITEGFLSNKRVYFEKEVSGLLLGISYSVIENIYSFERIFVFIITDLTEKREIEKKLEQKERFALIGEMSAGIAHELRNPLASISGSVQFLKKELKVEPEYKNLMDIIIKESSRLSNSIKVFLDYAKTTPLERTDFDLSKVVDDVAELVSLNQEKIQLVKKYNEGNSINADKKKVNQVIWNLINNSVKSLQDGGIIEINIYKQNEDVFLSIKDNGVGIEKSELGKIYTPFYSKFTSGIGLGMSIVKRIIDEHNFSINIKSEKNIGTEVIICFKTK